MTLKEASFSAVRWTTAAAVARSVMQLAQVAILARLLSPVDYGLMAIVTVVLNFATIFADLGLTSAYIQKQNVTPVQRSSLFWLNLTMGGFLTLVVLLGSNLIAGFFGDARLAPLLVLSSLVFVITAAGQQVKITAEKNLDFRPVALIEVSAATISLIVAIITAHAGWGVYALIFGAIVNASIITIMAWLFLSRGWRPIHRLQWIDIRPFVGFGSALVTNNVVNEFNRSIDLLLGGRMLAASALGLYSLPRLVVFRIQDMVNPIITRVGFPLIAQVQTDIPRVRAIYLKTANMTSSTNAPIYLGIAFFSPEIISILLGERWLSATQLLRLLALWGFLRSTLNPVGSLLNGLGRAELALKWNVAMLLLLTPALWAGSHYGTFGLAWSLLGFSMATFLPGWYVLIRPTCNARLVEYSIATLRPALIAILAIAPAYFITLPISNVYLHMTAGILISAPLYLGISYALNRDWLTAMWELTTPVRGSKTTVT
jgi:O-antigen/teichoic acid export membrane protein